MFLSIENRGIVSKGHSEGESKLTLLESGGFWERCGFAHTSVLGATFSNTPPHQIRRKKCQVQELRSETIPKVLALRRRKPMV